jgi:hypothetical protein
MLRLISALALLAIFATKALAQFQPDLRYVTSGEQPVYSEPRSDAPLVTTLPDGRNVYVREVRGNFARIDASGVAGPAFISIEGVRASPLPANAGRCECPGGVRSDGRLCGLNSALCKAGGAEGQCGMGPVEKAIACGESPR